MIENALRSIGMWFDSVIYGLVELLFRLILDLANLEIFSSEAISTFSNRVYIILGLVMLFKIIISFLQILINPDKMDDKEQGMGNILKRVVISLGLIVLVPSIFDLARDVQSELLPVIPKLVIGKDTAGTNIEETMNSAGQTVAWYSFSAFFTYYPGCEGDEILNGNNSDTATINSVEGAKNVVNSKNCPTTTSSGGYKYKYSWPLTTAVGVYLIWVFLNIAVQVAIRAIKFAICEIISPIPIASYVDPKTSKQTFDAWVSTTWKTYLDLFINLAIVYFIIYVFTIVFDPTNITAWFGKLGGDWGRIGLVTVFIIIGLLKFAKDAPKFLTSMLGIKDTGLGSIGEILKGKTALGLAGTGLAALGSGLGNAKTSWKNDSDLGTGARIANALRRGAGGMVGATRRGIVATASGGGWKEGFSQNIAQTRGKSTRRSTANALARISQNEYDVQVRKIDDEIKESERKLTEAKRNGDSITVEKMKKNIEKKQRERNLIPKPINPTAERFNKAFATWQGLESPTGASYSSAASSLSSARSTYFTGEAMKKLNEEGSKLDEVYHKYKNGEYYNFSQLSELKKQIDNGTFKGVDTSGKEITSKQVEEYYSQAQKLGAIDYINAVKDKDNKVYDEKTGSYVSVGNIENNTISEGFKQVAGMLDGLNIDPNMKKQLMSDFDANPGDFFKRLSDISTALETSGKRHSAYEQNQEKK